MKKLEDKRLQALAFDSAKLLAGRFPEYLERYAKSGEKVNPNHYALDSDSVNANADAIWEDADKGLPQNKMP